MRFRPAVEGDAERVRGLLLDAFEGADEADLVARLEADGDMTIAFVATVGKEIIGYAGFSRVDVAADGAPVPALGLAPVAVRGSHRRKGIARRLIQNGLAAANGRGIRIVFVLGDPDVYGPLGFRAETAAPFASPYAGPHLQAQWLSSPRRPVEGRADYAPAFAGLE